MYYVLGLDLNILLCTLSSKEKLLWKKKQEPSMALLKVGPHVPSLLDSHVMMIRVQGPRHILVAAPRAAAFDDAKAEPLGATLLSSHFDKHSRCLTKPLTVSDRPSSEDGAKIRVAYQGIAGAFSEAAALKAYPTSEIVPCNDFETVFKAVEMCLVDKAIVPLENSVAGSIHRVYDLLYRHRLHIVGEVEMEVDQCLMGLPGIRKDELKCVISHPMALRQCEFELKKLGIVGVDADDTAAAAQLIARGGLRDTGAVASARAAEIYGLDILAERFQDCEHIFNRFIVLAREPLLPGTKLRYRTSVVFALEEGPAALVKALAVFTDREINTSKIESRPNNRNGPLEVPYKGRTKYINFNYLFYIHFDASMAEPRAQNALGHLQEYTSFLRVLGCYPMDDTSEP